MYIYKTTNLINGKIYIGLSSRLIEESIDYLGSGKKITRAISKYGKENFKKEILEQHETLADLRSAEIKFIKEFKSTNRHRGYNISPGGDTNPDKQRVAIYQYSKEGDLIGTYKSIEYAINTGIADKNVYRKKLRSQRPIKGYWWSNTLISKEDVIALQAKYEASRSKAFKDAAAKRHADPKLAQFYKDNMRKVRYDNLK